MTNSYPNPFRINLETIRTCQRLRPERVEQLVQYMWASFSDTDDQGVDLVGDAAATTWDEFLTIIDDPDFVNDTFGFEEGEVSVEDTISTFECLAPQFDALDGDDVDLYIDLREIDPNTTTLPVGR